MERSLRSQFVRSNLRFIILFMLIDKPRTVKDIAESIFRSYGEYIYMSTIYYVIQNLLKSGLLTKKSESKEAVYSLSERGALLVSQYAKLFKIMLSLVYAESVEA